jgi:hypothetical protein
MRVSAGTYQASGVLGVATFILLSLYSSSHSHVELLSKSSPSSLALETQIQSLRNDIQQVKSLRKQAASLSHVRFTAANCAHSICSDIEAAAVYLNDTQ